MRRCSNCGETELNDADYCEKCGVKIEQVDTASPDESDEVSDANMQDEHETAETVETVETVETAESAETAETAKESEGKPTESAETNKKEPMSKKRIAIIVFGIIYFLIRIFGSDGDDGDKNHFSIVSNTAVAEEFYDKATGIWVDKNTVRLSDGQASYIYVMIDKNCIILGPWPKILSGRRITDVERVSNNKYRIHVRDVEPEKGRQGTQEIVFSGGKMYFTHADKQKFSRISHNTDYNDFIQVEREMRDYYRRYR